MDLGRDNLQPLSFALSTTLGISRMHSIYRSAVFFGKRVIFVDYYQYNTVRYYTRLSGL